MNGFGFDPPAFRRDDSSPKAALAESTRLLQSPGRPARGFEKHSTTIPFPRQPTPGRAARGFSPWALL